MPRSPQTKLISGMVVAMIMLGFSATAIAAPVAPLGYIGPGAGLGALGALLAVLGVIALGIAGIVLYPFQLLRKWIARRRGSAQSR